MNFIKPLLLLPVFFALSLLAAAPVPYSGKINIQGINYSGEAQFAFSLHDGSGTTHWINGKKPGDTIKVSVREGRYDVLLGGTGMNLLPPELFLNYDKLYLKVEFDDRDGTGLRHLTPDQLITATPLALVAEVSRIAQKVAKGAITAPMLSPALIADLNRTGALDEITRDMLPQDLLYELNQEITITREMIPEDVLNDINRTITKDMLGSDVLSEFNKPIVITREMLPQDVKDDLNKTFAITRDMLAADILSDINRSITLKDLDAQVIAELNNSLPPGSITFNMLAAGVRADLNRTITRSMLPEDVRYDLNRTIGINQLSSEISGTFEPIISGSPVSVVSAEGMSAKLAVEAEGVNLSYQWQKGGASLTGATSRILNITNLNITQHEGNYSVVVSNAFGQTTSGVAKIDINGSLTEGLVAWWKFDETNGTVAYDSSGNGNDGNLTNGPTWTTGKVKGALSFDGINDMVRTDLSGVHNEDLTWSAWIKTTDSQGAVIGLSADSWQVGGASFYIYQGRPKVDVHSVGAILGNEYLTSDAWIHYLLTVRDSGGAVDPVVIFVNGQIEKSSSLDWFNHNGQNFKLRIGHVPTHGEYYAGFIDDVRIYNRALSGFEVRSLYQLGEKTTGSTDSASGTIVHRELTDGSVTADKLANNTITTSQLNEQILKYLKPEITTQPQAQTVYADTNASYSVTAEGKYLSYQWKKDGTNLTGETNVILSITDANTTEHDGNYSVVVSNDFGSVESAKVEVKISDSLQNGLVGWWKHDETSGTVAYDSSGNGHDGNLTNEPTWANGKIGGALSFDGVDDRVKLPHSVINGLVDLTFSFWFLENQSNTNHHHFISAASSSAHSNRLLFGLKANGTFNFHAHDTNDVERISYQYTGALRNWSNIVLVRSISDAKLFLDGHVKAIETFTSSHLNIALNGLWIGGDQDSVGGGWSSAQQLNGLLDDVRIYDRALSAAEVQALYNIAQ